MPQDHSTIWNSCLQTIKDSVDPQSYRTWFEPIKPVKLMSNELTIQVPHRLFYEWLEEHYVEVLKNSVHKALGRNGKLLYQILNRNSNRNRKAAVQKENQSAQQLQSNQKQGLTNEDEEAEQIQNPFVIPGIRRPRIESNLNPRFTFDNFIEGDCNSLARNAAKAVADRPANTAFNPLVIHGPVGLGKTHLLQAIGNHVVERFPRKSVLYVTTDQFTNQIIDSIQKNATSDLLNFYQHVDVLLVDDIQQLYNRTKTQDIFFNLFNILRQNNKAIVLTCDRPIKDLNIEDRLKSRFQWGLTADLSAPALETRMAILNAKAENEEVEIPSEVAEFICFHIQENIRQLEGVLNNLVLHRGVKGQEVVDLELAKAVMHNFVTQINKEVTPEVIQKTVADHYGLEVDKLRSATRVRQVVLARQVSMFLVKQYTKVSLKAIGSLFGGRDHSTVLYSIRTIKDLMETDDDLKQTLEELERQIKIGKGE
ncbi:MAG: chromosomal replication initiator protein DnaA [Bacteroidota bacterium]